MKRYRTGILLVISILLIILGVRFIIVPMMEPEPQAEIIEPEIKKIWGLAADSLKIDTITIRPNQSLSDILFSKGIDGTIIDKLAQNCLGIFDVRKIKSGNTCYIVKDKQSFTPSYFIYEESAVAYYKFELTDSLRVEKGNKDVEIQRKTLCATIESSLWNSFVDQGTDPLLAIELSDIFAWTVDFFGIQKGDQFKVIYDIQYVDSIPVGFGKIHAATFEDSNGKISAYYFEKDGQKGYFDDKGNSLRKAFLKAPLNFSRISSRFSNSRMHPILKIRRPHYGIDYAAPTGTPVFSIGDGVVTQKGYQSGGGGNLIKIKHNSAYTTQYMHLSKFANGITAGSRVKQGQLIGYVGSTGLSSGPHLDFRVYQNNTPIDPLKIQAPPTEPISASNMALFNTLRDSISLELNKIDKPIRNQLALGK